MKNALSFIDTYFNARLDFVQRIVADIGDDLSQQNIARSAPFSLYLYFNGRTLPRLC